MDDGIIISDNPIPEDVKDDRPPSLPRNSSNLATFGRWMTEGWQHARVAVVSWVSNLRPRRHSDGTDPYHIPHSTSADHLDDSKRALQTKRSATAQSDSELPKGRNRMKKFSWIAAAVTETMPIVDRTADQQLSLSPSERDLLRRTWKDDYDFLFTLGCDIYTHIFRRQPSVKKLFRNFDDYGDNYRESPAFRSQALRFIQVLAQAVRNMSDLSQIDPLLHRVGERHVRFVAFGFNATHWELFRAAVIDTVGERIDADEALSADERRRAHDIWRLLTNYVISGIQRGFQAGLAGRRYSVAGTPW